MKRVLLSVLIVLGWLCACDRANFPAGHPDEGVDAKNPGNREPPASEGSKATPAVGLPAYAVKSKQECGRARCLRSATPSPPTPPPKWTSGS